VRLVFVAHAHTHALIDRHRQTDTHTHAPYILAYNDAHKGVSFRCFWIDH